jgi:acyl carrier protein
MDRLEIQDKVIDIIVKHSSIDRSAVTPDKHLKLDLGLDSLDVAEMVYEIEESFGISIADESADKIQRISDTVDFIQDRLAAVASEGLSAQQP